MSLGRLLTAGKCLMGLQQPPVRYRMRTQNLLPKFGGEKNPFAAPATLPAAQPIQAAAPADGKVARYQRSANELAAARLTETKKLPATMPAKLKALLTETPAPAATAPVAPVATHTPAAPVTPTAPAMIAPAAEPGWLGGTWQKISGWLARRESKPKSAIPKFTRPQQVQGELSLDNIRVVRNDLSDADVEVVLARTSVSKPDAARSVPAVAVTETPELIKTS